MQNVPHVRYAVDDDADALLKLRNHYILQSNATFDECVLTRHDVAEWMGRFRTDGPYRLLVALREKQLVGYCSSQPYRSHTAFAQTVETSVYTDPNEGRGGIGTRLYKELFARLAGERIHRVVVGIALPNEASIALHSKLGFRPVGVFDEYACKQGHFLSSQWMQRTF